MEQRDGFKLYECLIDATFSKARLGGVGIGTIKFGRGVKIMLLVNTGGMPVAAYSTSAGPHENRLRQVLFDFMASPTPLERIVGDKAYDSDALDDDLAERGIELIWPHRAKRRPENITRDGRPPRLYKRRWTVERSISWLQNFRRLCICREKSTCLFQAMLHFSCSVLLLKQVCG